MGCRTGANARYCQTAQRPVQPNRAVRRPQQTVEGNVVRKSAPAIARQTKIKRHKKRAELSASRTLRKQKVFLTIMGIIGSGILVCLCGYMLHTMDHGTTLADEVLEKENELDQLTVANDAREYEIGNSVDLNYIIDVATNELGMVRSNLSQVVTFKTRDTEYLQQVARVPSE